MDGLNVAQAIVSAVAVTLIATPLIVLAYLAGRRSYSLGRSPRLDHLHPDVALGSSTWLAEFDGDENPDASETIQFQLEQFGSRFLAVGRSADGTRHTLEGVIHHRRLSGVSIDENRSGDWLGTITVELQPGQLQMNGMRTRWSSQSQTLMVRRATFHRLETAAGTSDTDLRH